METKVITNNKHDIAVISSEKVIIKDVQTALDFIMSVQFETDSNRIALNKAAFCEDFFVLSTGLAGEILQKFVTYRVTLAIYGDFSKYTSQPLKDFIYESNKGNHIFFVKSEDEAVNKLGQI